MANEYTNKVVANNNTLIDLTSDTATAADVLEGRTLHLASGAPASGTYRPGDEIEARLEATVGHASKNLLPITLESGTYTTGGANLTYTVDKTAGTITINGTSRTDDNDPITLHIFDDSTSSLNGKLYFSGGSEHCPVRAYDGTNRAWAKAWNGVDNSPYSYSESQSSELAPVPGHETQYRIRIAANQTILNEVVKPMLRDGSISDDTFEPYVTPTDEKKQDKPVELDPSVLTWNIDDLISQYAYLQFVFMDMQTTSSRLFDIATVPTSQFMNLPVTQPSHVFGFSSIIAIRALGSTTGTSYITFDLNSDGTIDMSYNYTPLAQYLVQIIGIPK